MFISHLFFFFCEAALTENKAEAAVLCATRMALQEEASNPLAARGTGCSRKNSAVSPPFGIASAEESPLA